VAVIRSLREAAALGVAAGARAGGGWLWRGVRSALWAPGDSCGWGTPTTIAPLGGGAVVAVDVVAAVDGRGGGGACEIGGGEGGGGATSEGVSAADDSGMIPCRRRSNTSTVPLSSDCSASFSRWSAATCARSASRSDSRSAVASSGKLA